MYGAFNTNPYGPGSYPAMQNRLDNLQQQYQQQYMRPQQNPMAALSGRIVTGMEEARASQIPLDGTVSYFPSPAENKIYVKSIDMNGLPIFLTYDLRMPTQAQTQNNTQNVSVADLKNRIEAIEQKIKEMMTNHEPTTDSDGTNAQ